MTCATTCPAPPRRSLAVFELELEHPCRGSNGWILEISRDPDLPDRSTDALISRHTTFDETPAPYRAGGAFLREGACELGIELTARRAGLTHPLALTPALPRPCPLSLPLSLPSLLYPVFRPSHLLWRAEREAGAADGAREGQPSMLARPHPSSCRQSAASEVPPP